MYRFLFSELVIWVVSYFRKLYLQHQGRYNLGSEVLNKYWRREYVSSTLNSDAIMCRCFFLSFLFARCVFGKSGAQKLNKSSANTNQSWGPWQVLVRKRFANPNSDIVACGYFFFRRYSCSFTFLVDWVFKNK